MDSRALAHPQLMPIFKNILIHYYAFLPANRRGTGRIRMFLAMFSFVGSTEPDERELSAGSVPWPRCPASAISKKARQAVADLYNIGVIEDWTPGAGVNGSYRYKLWSGRLVNMVFACATGEVAIYAAAGGHVRVA